MWTLRKGVCGPEQFAGPYANALARQELYVSAMPEEFRPKVVSEQALRLLLLLQRVASLPSAD